MREHEMQKVTKCIGVNSIVEALINMICEQKIISESEKIMWKFYDDPTFH